MPSVEEETYTNSASLDSFGISTQWAIHCLSLNCMTSGTSAGCRKKCRLVATVCGSVHSVPWSTAYRRFSEPVFEGSTQLISALPSGVVDQFGCKLPAADGLGRASDFVWPKPEAAVKIVRSRNVFRIRCNSDGR